ncbi:MAG: branched-chain amino acid ABC transporter substrate-binding protein [Anaerolineae bacterium]|nr:branched-chain amino acid ABC transporter substrate-binding protein [Anaerolineae bacterium]
MSKRKILILSLFILAGMTLAACGGGGAAAFECDDALGCVSYAPGEAIRIASALVITGPDSDLGLDSQRGIEIGIAMRGDVLGHSVELQAEDDGCGPEGGQTSATKIVSDPTIVAVIGTSCSGAGVPASKIISDAGYVMVSPSNTAPVLTDAETHEAGYLRTAHNDKVQGRAMAEFAYSSLGVRTAAALHDGDPYTEGLASSFKTNFEELGGTVVAFEAVDKNADDMRPVLTTVAASGNVEFLYYPVFTKAGANITKQAREVEGLENVVLAGADGMLSPSFLEAAGDAAEGMYLSGPNLAFEGGIYPDFIAKHDEMYGIEPTSVFHAHAFDAFNMIMNAIESVAVVDDDGTIHIGRQALRDALFATADFVGITGTLTCNEYGDCANAQIAVNQVKSGEFEAIWP